MGAVDDFLAGLDPDARSVVEQIVTLALAEVPDAEQGTSYGVAALRHRGKPLVGLAEAASHLSLFPFSPAVVERARPRLEDYSVSKGTIRFTRGHPLPDEVVTEIVRDRRDEIDAALR